MLWLCLWSVYLCSCNECEVHKTWIAWMELVGGIYSLQPLPSRWLSMAHRTVRWCTRHGTVHCPVPATSADRCGLERWTVEVLCLLAAPDMFGAICLRCSDIWLLHCALLLFTQSTVGAFDRCSVGSPDTVRCTPDSPVNYSGAIPWETREWSVHVVLGLGTGQCPVHTGHCPVCH
jgi:hypothetical protein